MIVNEDDTEEQYLFQQLDYLKLQYEHAAKPYLERLSQIRSSKPIRIEMTLDEARLHGFIE